jgi:hypothetical protein
VDRPATAWTPANKNETNGPAEKIRTSVTPPDANAHQHKLSSLKARREERERTRVSRACDRCKKYVKTQGEYTCYGLLLKVS